MRLGFWCGWLVTLVTIGGSALPFLYGFTVPQLTTAADSLSAASTGHLSRFGLLGLKRSLANVLPTELCAVGREASPRPSGKYPLSNVR